MKTAKRLANWYSTTGQQAAQACVYEDGVVIYLAVTEETMKRIERHLEDRLHEFDRSDDGFCYAAIVSLDDWERSLDDVSCEVELTWSDNRGFDLPTIGDFMGLIP